MSGLFAHLKEAERSSPSFQTGLTWVLLPSPHASTTPLFLVYKWINKQSKNWTSVYTKKKVLTSNVFANNKLRHGFRMPFKAVVCTLTAGHFLPVARFCSLFAFVGKKTALVLLLYVYTLTKIEMYCALRVTRSANSRDNSPASLLK